MTDPYRSLGRQLAAAAARQEADRSAHDYLATTAPMMQAATREEAHRGDRRDVFISHASEDKDAVARPLAEELVARGLTVWFDESELMLGDSLSRKIDEGLAQSQVGVVILSHAFFAKWPQRELDGLTQRLISGESNVIVPIWHDLTATDLLRYSPPLSDLLAGRSQEGPIALATQVRQVLVHRARTLSVKPVSATEHSGGPSRSAPAEKTTDSGGTVGAPDVDRGIVDALNAWGQKERPLAAVCALVEDQLAAHLAELMLLRVETMAQSTGRRFRSVPQRGFFLDAHAYEVRITEHPTDPATVQLAIVKASAGQKASSPRAPIKLSLDGHGLYSVGMLYVDDDLKSIEELLATDVQATFAAGYRWLEAHVLGELLAIEHRINSELYMEVRSVLPPVLADAVGLYGVSKQDAFYLLDQSAVQTAFARAIERRANVAASPIEVTRLLVTQMLDPGETISRVSLAEGRRLALKLEDSPYASTGLNLVERVFYDTNYLMHYPLVREGRLRVTAAYPASMDEQIAPALARIADRCAEIVHTHARFVLQRAYGQHKAPTLLQSLANLGGWFTGGFVDSIK